MTSRLTSGIWSKLGGIYKPSLRNKNWIGSSGPYKRTRRDYSEYFNDSDEERFLYDLEPLKVIERMREGNTPVGLKNIGNTCYFNCFMQILYFLPEFGRKMIEIDIKNIK